METAYLLPTDKENLARFLGPVSVVWGKDPLKNLGLLDILPKTANKLKDIDFLPEYSNFFHKKYFLPATKYFAEALLDIRGATTTDHNF